MASRLIEGYSYPVKKDKPESMLAEWMGALSDFHMYFTKLITYVNSNQFEQAATGRKKVYIGQCPVAQLVTVTIAMQNELRKLTQNADCLNTIGQNTDSTDYKTLAGHIAIITKLNKEAKQKLRLASLPAS